MFFVSQSVRQPSRLVQHNSGQFPNMVKLGYLALSSPEYVHTVGEQGFSGQDTILTSLRNKLTTESQDTLLRVKLRLRALKA